MRTAHPAPPAKRVSAIDALLSAVASNSVAPGGDLYTVCERDGFKMLAWALWENRNWLRREKSEFETQAEYEARTRRVENALNGFGEVVVCQPLDDNEDAPFTYRAEDQHFEGSFREHQNVWRDSKRLGSYVSRTRMGVRARVTSEVEIDYDLKIEGLAERGRGSCLQGSYGAFSYRVPVARERAPLVKRTHYLAFAGKVVTPFVDSSDTPGSPTLDDPTDTYERDITIYLRPTAMAVVGPGGDRPFACDLTGPTPQAVQADSASAQLAALFTAEDYPASALRNHEQGLVEVRLDVGPAGRVTNCTIATSSGSAALDSATCRILTMRARLSPGGGVTTRIRWTLPD
jgi:TonB family protein